MWVGISETTRLLSVIIIILFKIMLSFTFFDLNFMVYINPFKFNIFPITISEELNKSYNIINNKHFYEWLAGLIDGDGYFYFRKLNRLTSLVITFESRDNKTAKKKWSKII
jgi:hypothetical protein